MTKFDIVSSYKDKNINLPKRKTKYSAGYDFEVAEDIIIPSYHKMCKELQNKALNIYPLELQELGTITKDNKIKPTLIPTGIKCYLKDNQYLELSVRSSCPLKYWIILANGVGIIDSDYVDNSDNEGHIYFQVINLSPFDIQLKKGDTIGQGIIRTYDLTDDDNSNAERTGGFGSTDNISLNSYNNFKHNNIIDDSYQIYGGTRNKPINIEYSSQCEGFQNQACGQYSQAEGIQTFAQSMENLANVWKTLSCNATIDEASNAISAVSKCLAGEKK